MTLPFVIGGKMKKKNQEAQDATISVQEAQAAIAQEQMERVKRCEVAIQQALTEHNCSLDVSVTIKVNQIIPRIDIVAK